MHDFPESPKALASIVRSALPKPIPWSNANSIANLTATIDYAYYQLYESCKSRIKKNLSIDMAIIALGILDAIAADNPEVKVAWAYRGVEEILRRAGLQPKADPPDGNWLFRRFRETVHPSIDLKGLRDFFLTNWDWVPK